MRANRSLVACFCLTSDGEVIVVQGTTDMYPGWKHNAELYPSWPLKQMGEWLTSSPGKVWPCPVLPRGLNSLNWREESLGRGGEELAAGMSQALTSVSLPCCGFIRTYSSATTHTTMIDVYGTRKICRAPSFIQWTSLLAPVLWTGNLGYISVYICVVSFIFSFCLAICDRSFILFNGVLCGNNVTQCLECGWCSMNNSCAFIEHFSVIQLVSIGRETICDVFGKCNYQVQQCL